MKSNLEKTFEKVEQKKDAPAKPKKKRSVPRVASIVGIGIGLILALNVGIYLHKTQIENVHQELLKRLAAERVQKIADDVAQYVIGINAALRQHVERPTLVSAVVLDNAEAIEKTKKSVAGAFNGFEALQIIQKGTATLNDALTPPVRFTELEMIRRAESREQVLVEATNVDGQWYLKAITPLPVDQGQEVIATLLLTLSIEPLKELVYDNKISLGRLELLQQFGNNKPISVFSAGNGAALTAEVKAIPNTYWSIHFTPSYALASGAGRNVVPVYLTILAVAAALVGLCYFLGRLVGGIVDQKLKARVKSTTAATGDGLLSEGEIPRDLVNPLYQKTDILDVDIAIEDEDLLGLEEVSAAAPALHSAPEEDILDLDHDDGSIPDVVFRAYDIRGLAYKEITPQLASLVGQALGSEAVDSGQDTIIVARDGRLSSPELAEALVSGILSSGCNVLNIGVVPTPVLYFAAATLKESQSGVMVTASHNPGEYNGFKVVMNGKSRSDDDIKAIRRRILRKDLYEGQGDEEAYDIVPEYIDTIFSDVALAGDITIVIDAANGVTGSVAPQLFEELGCQVIPLFCEVDGNFPNHSPDPSIESNLQALIDKVKETQADLGVAFDGDGDRLIVVTSSGKVIWPDQLLLMFAKDIVSRNPGTDVVFDVKSTRHLASCITSYGGRPIMWKTGHAPMKNKMAETKALLGGEFSGHIFIKDRWFGFDDGMYAAARLIEILSLQGQTLDEIFDEFPKSPSTPEIRIAVGEDEKFVIVEKLAAEGDFSGGRVTDIDGVRVDFAFGWGLVRASNTSANLTLRFEANDEASLVKVKAIMAKELQKVAKQLAKQIDVSWNS